MAGRGGLKVGDGRGRRDQRRGEGEVMWVFEMARTKMEYWQRREQRCTQQRIED